jgi:hypothetical protein
VPDVVHPDAGHSYLHAGSRPWPGGRCEPDAAGLLTPAVDFWIFDGSITVLNHFASDGSCLGEDWINDPELAELSTAAFAEVWQRATRH